MSVKSNIVYINRQTGKQEEEIIYYEGALRFLYESFLGKLFCNLIARLSFFSKLGGMWERLPRTRTKILPFIEKYQIDPSTFQKKITEFASFDDFFTRHLKNEARPIAAGPIIPADGRYLVYQNIESCDGFVVKGKKFPLERLLGSKELCHTYKEGSMVIARLAPCDYHRFHFPADCIPLEPRLINGPLFSVNPIAIKQNVELLAENKRVLTVLETKDYGNILFIEIGATNVGSIHQTYIPNKPYKKGDEKGYFSFGGSSLILLFEKDKIQFADDLISNSAKHIETLCQFGQSLDRLQRSKP